MGERITPAERDQLIHRHHMRIRTIAVSFAAAVSSAHRDLHVGPAERDALIETWRAWSLGVLAEYGEEIDLLLDGEDAAPMPERDLRAELAGAIDAVRRA